jgi:hypothetical protein
MPHALGTARGALSLAGLAGLAACAADPTTPSACPASPHPAVNRVTAQSITHWGAVYEQGGTLQSPPDSVTLGVTVGASLVPADGGRLELRVGPTLLESAPVVRGAADPISVALTVDWRPSGRGPVTFDVAFVARPAAGCPAVRVDGATLSIDYTRD